jgi:hypothetical protein
MSQRFFFVFFFFSSFFFFFLLLPFFLFFFLLLSFTVEKKMSFDMSPAAVTGILKKHNIDIDSLFASISPRSNAKSLAEIAMHGATRSYVVQLKHNDLHHSVQDRVYVHDLSHVDFPKHGYISGMRLSYVLNARGVDMIGRLRKVSSRDGQVTYIVTHETTFYLSRSIPETMVKTHKWGPVSVKVQGTWFVPALTATERDLGSSIHNQDMALQIAQIEDLYPTSTTLNVLIENDRLTISPSSRMWIFDCRYDDSMLPVVEKHVGIMQRFLQSQKLLPLVATLTNLCPPDSISTKLKSHIEAGMTGNNITCYYVSELLMAVIKMYMQRMDSYLHVTLQEHEHLELVFECAWPTDVIPREWEFCGELHLYSTTVPDQ